MFGFLRRYLMSESVSPETSGDTPENEAESRVIQACRDRFGPPPRSLEGLDAETCQLNLTPEVDSVFTKSKDPMLRILTDQARLRNYGQVVWGQLVQANQLLFDPSNKHTLAANVVYSLDPYFDGRVDLLSKIALGLFAQKGTFPDDPEIRKFVRVITDERIRIMRKELPRGYCGGRSIYFTNCFIQPSHLPGNCLRRPKFPLLVCFRKTEGVMVLPSRFWPERYVSQWVS